MRTEAGSWIEPPGALFGSTDENPALTLDEANDTDLTGSNVALVRVAIDKGGDDGIQLGWIIVGSADAQQAILDIRYNATTHNIQVTYKKTPAEADWIDKIQFVACEGPSLGEFLSF